MAIKVSVPFCPKSPLSSLACPATAAYERFLLFICHLVALCQESVAVGGKSVGDGVGGAGDSLEEVAAGEVAVSEGISAVADGLQTTRDGIVAISGLVVRDGVVIQGPAGVAAE